MRAINRSSMLGLVLSLIILVFIAYFVDIKNAVALLGKFNPRILVICAATYFMAHLFRALRFSLILGKPELSLRKLLCVVTIHNFLLFILPMKIGEGGYPMLLKKTEDIPYIKSIPSLIISRVNDMAAFIILFSIFIIARLLETVPTWINSAVCIIVFSLCLLIVCNMNRILKITFLFIEKAAVMFGLGRRAAIDEKRALFHAELSGLTERGSLGAIMVCSLLVWLLTFSLFFEFVRGLDSDIGFIQSALGSSGAVFAGFLPVNAPGSVGTLEAGWTIGYVLTGINKETALASGLIMHAFIILFGLIASALALLILGQNVFNQKKNG